MIDILFPNFNNVYGRNKNLTIEVKTDIPAPTISISQTNSAIHANASIHIKNPYNPQYDAVIIQCIFDFSLRF